jgi:hypothetical protein
VSRAHAISVRRRALVAIVVLSAAACGVPAPSSAPASSAAATPTDDLAAGRRADLEQLVERLDTLHRNPYLDEGEAAFRARVEAVAQSAGERTDSGFLVDVMRLMGNRDRDGHSGAWAMAQTGDALHARPLWLREFPDGLRVVAARAPYEYLVGAVVTAVGGTPIEQAWDLVVPLVPADNDSNRRATLPMYLLLPEVVEDVGVQQPGAAALTVRLPDGTTTEVDPEPLPIDAYRDWVFGVYPRYPTAMPPDENGSRERRRRDESFWTETLPDGTLYVAYHEVRGKSGDMSIGALANAVESATGPVVVDLRANPGGDNTTYGPFRDALREKATRAGGVALLTSRDTFSAAGNFVTELKVGDGGERILLVGEPPGGGLNIYGDTSTVTLENSGIVVLISRRYHEKAPGDDRLQIEPDVPVEATWDDAAAGRDPVLDAALDALHSVASGSLGTPGVTSGA